MTAKIIALPPRHTDMSEIISEMQEADLSECVVIGWRRDGTCFLSDNLTTVREGVALLALAQHVYLSVMLEKK